MRRTHLRKTNNILKRLLIHAMGFNLALMTRSAHGIGKPRTLQGLQGPLFRAWIVISALSAALWAEIGRQDEMAA